jgi:delta 1-pyrroline-5-carboxylate dehydrogenase
VSVAAAENGTHRNGKDVSCGLRPPVRYVAPSVLYPLGGPRSASAARGGDELTLSTNARTAWRKCSGAKRAALLRHAAAAMRRACASSLATVAAIVVLERVPNLRQPGFLG